MTVITVIANLLQRLGVKWLYPEQRPRAAMVLMM